MDLIEIEKMNPWWSSKNWQDSKLEELSHLPLKYKKKIKLQKGLNIIYGPRQVGKTTWIKQTIKDLEREDVLFLACDGMFSAQELKDTLLEILKIKDFSYIFLDEITFIENWEQTVKYLIDNFNLKNKYVVVTGSSSINILRKKERLPGRIANIVPFYPITFKEFVRLKTQRPSYEELWHLFRRFLIHGGYLKYINEFELNQTISLQSLESFSYGLDGELALVKKDPRIFSYILSKVVNALTNQVSWSTIAGSFISSPTVYDYVETGKKLMFLDYIENKLSYDKAFVKNKKIYFVDPYHFWVALFRTKKIAHLTTGELLKYESKVVENFVFSEFIKRGVEVYYYKDRTKEIDFIINKQKIEVKWTNQTPKRKDKDVLILTKHDFGDNKMPVYTYFFNLSTHL